ncbi:hypothetical protein QOZ80_6BG0471790 [Eleusine coracana subsp. coracana]|nr:hypothetical protein QOZ80_6BG0471790 [Eleusine coracana subsp. coracana]
MERMKIGLEMNLMTIQFLFQGKMDKRGARRDGYEMTKKYHTASSSGLKGALDTQSNMRRKEYLSATRFYGQDAIEEERDDDNDNYDDYDDDDDENDYEDDSEGEDDEAETDLNDHDGIEQQVKRKGRGPTKMESLWKEHDPENKIYLKLNRFGQPCGLKTCKLTNFIGTLVKGKEIPLAARNWSKVHESAKEKLWQTVQRWVLRSASKKWKDFKVVLKKNYFKPNLSIQQNINNGCARRIPHPQWAWLVKHWMSAEAKVKSEKNKAVRAMQLNGTHTTGSRSFAVALDQLELQEGQQVGRAKLYVVSHTKKNGEPVDKYSGDKIEEIKSKFEAEPALCNEEVHDGDVFSGLFPKERSGTWRGLGLLVGGSNSKNLAEIKAELQEARNEKIKLWSVVETLMKNQSELQQQHNALQQKHNELNDMWLASQGHKPASSCPKEKQSKDLIKDTEGVDNREIKISEVHAKLPSETNNLEKVASLSSRNSKRSEVLNEPGQEAVSPCLAPKKRKIAQHKEKTPPQSQKTKLNSLDHNLHKKSRKFKTPLQKDGDKGDLKRGMEVGLISPQSDSMVALATIQSPN